MNLFTEKGEREAVKDGLYLIYVKDDTIYPVALSEEQQKTFDIIQQVLPQPIKVIGNMPMGTATTMSKYSTQKNT